MPDFVVKLPILHENKRYGVGELIDVDLKEAEALWKVKAIDFPTPEDLRKKAEAATVAPPSTAAPLEDSPFLKAMKANELLLAVPAASPALEALKKAAPEAAPKNAAPDDTAKNQAPDADVPDASKKAGK